MAWSSSSRVRQSVVIETYIPLYRKYRPQQFSDLVGQEVVSTAIGNALTLNKIAHAYLFCGPRGTGKTSSARIFAKSLNCVEGPTPTPCQTCPSCEAITQGTALDVTEIDAASNNGVENIRELTDKVQFSPIQGKFKVYIIDEVHMLSTAAFNALLKTLEEPPPNVVFIFATTEPHKVLPTIISRCQRFDFSRITRNQIEDRIRHVAQLEGIRIAEDAVRLIARHVRGGLRDALGLLDQVSVLGRSSANQEIRLEDVRAFIGILEEDVLLALTQGLVEKDPEQLLGQIHYLQERGVEPVQMVKELTQHFRNLLIAKTCGPEASGETFDIAPDLYPKLCQQAQGFEVEEIPQILSRLSLLESQIKNSHQPQLWLEVGLLDVCYRQEIHVVKHLAERVAALEAALSKGGSIPQAASSAPKPSRPGPVAEAPKPVISAPPVEPTHSDPPPAAPPPKVEQAPSRPVAQGDLSQHWQAVINAIPHLPTKALVKDHFMLLEMAENTLTLGYAKETLFETLRRSPEKYGHLEQAVQVVFGKPYKLNFVPHTDVPPAKVTIPPPRPVAETLHQPVMHRESQSIAEPPTLASAAEAPTNPVAVMAKAENGSTASIASIAPGDTALVEDEVDIELQQVKKYTQELLQGKLID